MSLFESLKHANAADWHDYTQHPFVEQMASGELPLACFQHYLKQDYLFLIQFTRAWGLAIYKTSDLEAMRYAQAGLNAMLDTEMALHVAYCQDWGIDPATLPALPEAAATVAYTRYVLDCGQSGDLLDLHIALLPCISGYGEIAQRILPQMTADNPYRSWAEMYAGEEYANAMQTELEWVEKLALNSSETRQAQLSRIFATATRMESAFWQMGLDLSE